MASAAAVVAAAAAAVAVAAMVAGRNLSLSLSLLLPLPALPVSLAGPLSSFLQLTPSLSVLVNRVWERISRLRRPYAPGQPKRGEEDRDRVPASDSGLLACSLARFSPRKSPTTRSPALLARLTLASFRRERTSSRRAEHARPPSVCRLGEERSERVGERERANNVETAGGPSFPRSSRQRYSQTRSTGRAL